MVTFVLMRGFGVGGGEPCLGRSLMWGQVVPAGSPGMALPGPDVVSPGFSLILLLLTLSQRRLGRCGSALQFSLSALPRSMTTASGRSRARQPACRPAPPAARRCRRPEGCGRSVCACILLSGTRDTATDPPRPPRVRPPPRRAAPPLRTPLLRGHRGPGQLPLPRRRPLCT